MIWAEGEGDHVPVFKIEKTNALTKLPPIAPPPPPPSLPPPSDISKKPTKTLKIATKPIQLVDRTALLKSIQKGVHLRKTITNDKSGLIFDEEQQEITLRSRPESVNSIDSSQGFVF